MDTKHATLTGSTLQPAQTMGASSEAKPKLSWLADAGVGALPLPLVTVKGTASNLARRCSLNLIEGEGDSRLSDVDWKGHHPPLLLQHVMCKVRCTSICHSSVPISRRQEKKGSSVPLWHCTDSEMALPSKRGHRGPR